MQKSDLNKVAETTCRTLERISRSFWSCQIFAVRPRRFKYTLRDEADFDRTIYVDLLCIDNKTVLYVVDEATRYQEALWLPFVTAG